MLDLLKDRFSPFRHQSFRRFFFAQTFSLVGTWSHELARAWLVLELEGTATALGTLLLSTALPGLFFTLHGGVIADKSDARKLLYQTKLVLAIAALAFAFMTEFNYINLWIIIGFGVVEGLVNSFDGPAFTSLFGRLTPREDFQQSLALQSTSFHVARMLGPLVAGVLMAWHGPSLVFLVDGLSYIAVLFVIKNLKLRDRISNRKKTDSPGTGSILEGFRFFMASPTMRYKVMQFIFNIAIIIPVMNLVFRTYLKHKFELSAAEFGYLFSAPAFGAMGGAVVFTLAKFPEPIKNLRYAVPAVIVTLVAVVWTPSSYTTAIALAVCGFFSYLTMASVTQSLHLDTSDDFRGRLGSLIFLGFMTVGPLMSFPIGVYTDKFGYDAAIIHCTAIYALLSAGLGISYFRAKTKVISTRHFKS